MDKIMDLIRNGIEGRRLEFKEFLPTGDILSKTVVAFSNSVGGNLIIGIKDKTREIIGVDENEILALEEKVSNIIHNRCEPIILPEISIYRIDDKLIMLIKVFPGSNLPYYLKSKGKEKGTIIRAGSSNRLADRAIIANLERKKQNISYDSEAVYEFADQLELTEFTEFYNQKTGRKIGKEQLISLGLLIKERNTILPARAGILLEKKERRESCFRFAQVNCGRFKGRSMSVILDQYCVDNPIFAQPEEVMNFIKRNIAQSSTIGEVYRENRWEYPLIAVREAVINAIIHRDYSMLGSDIKVAIFDDMLEITSPGSLPANFDIFDIYNNPSEIRNRVLAPIFKDLKLIEQWGSGMKKIKNEMEQYPELELKINELGNATQIQFIKTNYIEDDKVTDHKPAHDIAHDTAHDTAHDKDQISDQEKKLILAISDEELTRKEIFNKLKITHRTTYNESYLKPAKQNGLVELTIPDKPQSKSQKYRLTEKGIRLLERLIEGEL
ncbi:MAG: putative DNA binding domain-containing protein [Candidatus Cloacimonetes bacterium]|nr:putative DNA binding domain-containing protein [Candidatus Cloacimonadota bacterium]